LVYVPVKCVSGFSELSTLQLPLATIAGWATLHGPNLMELGYSTTDATTARIWDALTAKPDSLLNQSASKHHQRQGAGWPGTVGPQLDEETRWKRMGDGPADLQINGRLIGGCLDTISRLTGTRFGNVPAFIKACGADGTLLYLENAEMSPVQVARALHNLRMNGWFDGVSGVLLGRNAVPDSLQPDSFNYIDALESVLGDLQCPVLYDLDIGHVPPQLSLVNGALAQVELREGQGCIVQRLQDFTI